MNDPLQRLADSVSAPPPHVRRLNLGSPDTRIRAGGSSPSVPSPTVRDSRRIRNVAWSDQGPMGVQLYQTHCDKCSWSSLSTPDVAAYLGLVSELDVHKKYEHQSTAEEPAEADEGHKGRREFEAATTPRTIPESKDDRNYLLHLARFFPGSVNWINQAKACPLVQAPRLSVIDLSAIGLQALNQKTVKDCHDRSCRTLKLQHFGTENLRATKNELQKKYNLSGGEMIEGKEYLEVKSVHEAVIAVLNFTQLWRYVHPGDLYPESLLRVVIERYFDGEIHSAAQVIKFFSTIHYENSNRACRREVPLTHEEVSSKWDLANRQYYSTARGRDTNGMSSAIKTLTSALSSYNRAGKRQSSQGPSNARKKTTAKSRTLQYCQSYNSSNGCSNTRTAEGCQGPNGAQYAHGCSVRVPPGNHFCNSKDHCSKNH